MILLDIVVDEDGNPRIELFSHSNGYLGGKEGLEEYVMARVLK